MLTLLAQGKEESKRALKEALLEAKEQDLKLRNEFERETKEKKAEIQRMEQRITQKEDALDKKTEALEQQKSQLFQKEYEVQALQEKLNSQHELMIQELEKVAQLTSEEAKAYLISNIRDEVTHEMAMKVKEVEAQFKEESETRAKNIWTFNDFAAAKSALWKLMRTRACTENKVFDGKGGIRVLTGQIQEILDWEARSIISTAWCD